MNKKNRRAHLEELKSEQRTMIFYEAPHKLTATLRDLREAFGAERRISLCRELSKLHEEIRRTTLGEAESWYGQNPPKGEFVLVVGGGLSGAEGKADAGTGAGACQTAFGAGEHPTDAVRQAAEELALSRNALYEASMAEKS